MSDQLNDFIAAQHVTNVHLAEGMTRVQTLLEENTKRLFGGDGGEGALPFIMRTQKENAKTAEERCEKVETRAASLEGWRKSSLAWIAGAVAVLTLEGTALAFYFNSVANHVKTLAGH